MDAPDRGPLHPTAATLDVLLYQISYDEASWAAVQQSGFSVLDNLANDRPDWYEYWPIRRFLLTQELREDAFYGFFSPKFTHKTQLVHADVVNFVRQAHARHAIDIALFSPQPDMAANFLSVFEQAEVFDPGFNQVAQAFVESLGLQFSLAHLVMDARQIVYSNYFVATPRFWRRWFQWTEALFRAAEDPAHPLYAGLNHNTSYGVNAHRKVFLMERLASLLLYVEPGYHVAVANPFGFGWSMAKFRLQPHTTYINDALKRAYRDTGFPQYMEAFKILRAEIANNPPLTTE